MEIKGIDVSRWQGSIDWKAVAADGVQFAMIKAASGSSSGRITLDPRFGENIRGAIAAGVRVGVYLYSYAHTAEAARLEAQNLVAVLSESRELITYPVAYDLEDASQKALGRAVNTAMAEAFCAGIRSAGYQPMLYTYKSYLDTAVDLPAGVPLWLARTEVSAPGMDCAMWQYSHKGSVAGISGDVDLNVSYVDYAAAAQPQPWETAIDALVQLGRMDSPEVWRAVCRGERSATPAQVRALLSKWADDVEASRVVIPEVSALQARLAAAQETMQTINTLSGAVV